MSRREALHAAARNIAEREGISQMSIRRVTAEAGVSIGSFYTYFGNIDGLLREVARASLLESQLALASRLAEETDPLQRIQLRGEAYVEWGVEHPEYYVILFSTPARAEHELTPEQVRASEGHPDLTGLRDDVAAAMATGAVPPGDPDVMATMLWMNDHGFVSLLVSLPDFPWPTAKRLEASWDLFRSWGLQANRHPQLHSRAAVALEGMKVAS